MPMETPQFNLIKRDVNADASIEISTYLDLGDGQYVTCKNDKARGWASTLIGGIEIHDMFAGIHCGKEVDDPIFKLISKTRLK